MYKNYNILCYILYKIRIYTHTNKIINYYSNELQFKQYLVL